MKTKEKNKKDKNVAGTKGAVNKTQAKQNQNKSKEGQRKTGESKEDTLEQQQPYGKKGSDITAKEEIEEATEKKKKHNPNKTSSVNEAEITDEEEKDDAMQSGL